MLFINYYGIIVSQAGKGSTRQTEKERNKKMKNPYVIIDPKGHFFRDYTESIPAVIHSFTDSWPHAMKFATLRDAEIERDRLLDRLYDFGGNKKVPKGYLRIGKAEIVVVG